LIPEYQRPYVWTPDNVNDLLEDLWFAYENNPENEYFVGSLVLRKIVESKFNEYEVLDGQQRLTTFALIFSVLKNITDDNILRETLNKKLFQQENPYDNIPERHRIIYKIRGHSNAFLKKVIQDRDLLEDTSIKNIKDVSVQNMLKAIEIIKSFFTDEKSKIQNFAKFILNIYLYMSQRRIEKMLLDYLQFSIIEVYL